MLCWTLLILFRLFVFCLADSANVTPNVLNSTNDIEIALDHVDGMLRDLHRFYKQWDSLSSRIAKQGIGWAIESCARDHKVECTTGKRSELTSCIVDESKIIHDQVVVIYDKTVREPWEVVLKNLKYILQHPEDQGMDKLNETVWTVHPNNVGEQSVRYRFYLSQVNFQLPVVAPQLHPIDKVYKLCLDRHFPK